MKALLAILAALALLHPLLALGVLGAELGGPGGHRRRDLPLGRLHVPHPLEVHVTSIPTTARITIAPAVRACLCPLCLTEPGRPCQPKPEGDHLARYLEAHIAGALTREYMSIVLGELVVIDACVVIEGQAADVPPSVRQRLDAGHTLTYVPDPVWGGFFADLRTGRGADAMVETGWGITRAAAAADLARRLGGAR